MARKLNSYELEDLNEFSNLSKNTINLICESASVCTLEKGHHIFRDKDKINYIYIVLSGKVALYKLNEWAQKRVVFILGEGSIINAVILDDLRASINCEVFEMSEIISINKQDFIKIMKADFDFTKIVLKSLSIKVRRLYRQSKNAVPIKIEKKVAAKLWKLANDYGVKDSEGTLININLSITYLADMFGAQRETISRALKILQGEDLVIIKNKKIIVKDKDRLVKYFKGIE